MRVSLVIPAYNEEGRLPAFLEELVTFRRKAAEVIHEVLVVDDGSRDRTAARTAMFQDLLPLRLIRSPKNRGKGAAVRAGVLEATADAVVFMDADGATSPWELPKMLAALTGAPVAVGNRWMPGSQVEGRETFRAFSGWVYRTYVGYFGLRGIDTMCGFKGFHRAVGQELFASLREERWLFDTEIMLRAVQRRYRVESFPIRWTSKHGSKLRLPVLLRAFFEIPFLAARVAGES